MTDFVYYTRHLGYLISSVIKKHLYELQKFRQQHLFFLEDPKRMLFGIV